MTEQFVLKQRGDYREELLTNYRWGLRKRTNPSTGVKFTEDELTTLTAEHGDSWIKADAIDAVLMVDQARATWLLAQLDPKTASSSTLDWLWSQLWAVPYAPAAGGTGLVSAPAPAGTTFTGSAVLGDPAAVWGTVDGGPADGLKFQVVYDVESPMDGSPAELVVAGIDTGFITNVDVNTRIKWQNAPDTVTELATVLARFTGGNPPEDDQTHADRVVRRIRHKPGAANNARVAAWIEDSSTSSVDIACVWACALHSGTLVATYLQRRGNVRGPAGRLPTPGTLAIVTARMVPPGSPLMPPGAEVWLTGITPVPANMVVSLSMPRGSESGFGDFFPFPGAVGGVPATITALTDQTHFQVTSLLPLPFNVTQPAMMVWDDTISRFEQLAVGLVALSAGDIYNVVLTSDPDKTLAIGDYISPWTEQAALIDVAVEQYFDQLGPGELVASTDPRWHRAFRFPDQVETHPQAAGSAVLNFIADALGGSLAHSILDAISVSTPSLPADPRDGPKMIVAGKVSITAI